MRVNPFQAFALVSTLTGVVERLALDRMALDALLEDDDNGYSDCVVVAVRVESL
jgi:hypothetical protein